MREKLKILSEILKQNTAIKERLERLEFGCWVKIKYFKKYKIINFKVWDSIYYTHDFINSGVDAWKIEKKNIEEIIGREPQFSDILEYLGEDYYMNSRCIWWYKDWEPIELFLDTWPLSSQLDETLDEIISLCKNVWK